MSTWAVSTTHPAGTCDACGIAVTAAVGIAQATGSTGATHSDGYHVATVTRQPECPSTPHGTTSVVYDTDGHADAWVTACATCAGSWDVTP